MAADPLFSPGFRDALVILGATGLVIPAFHRLRISPVIGFILVGLLIGPAGLGRLGEALPWVRHISIDDREVIDPFAEIGIILLLFSIGLELSFRRLWDLRGLVFIIGPAELAISGGLIGVLLHQFTDLGAVVSLMLGIALAMSSTALVLPMTGTKSAIGKPAFAMLLFEDLAIVPIIFVMGVISPLPGSDDAGDLTRTVVLGALVVVALLGLGKLLLPRLFRQAARTKSPELFLAVSMVVVMGASLATSAVGLSPIVGALVAGLVIAETEYRMQVEVTVEPFKNLALGVFLMTVGMSLDFELIARMWPFLMLAIVGIILVKAFVTSGLLRLSGAPRGVAANVGVLMASPSETTLIVLAAAVQARVIDTDTAAFWQIVTAVGLTATPLLARIGSDTARRVDPAAREPAREPSENSGCTIVAGYGRVGQMVADMLVRHEQSFVIVDADIDMVELGRKRGHEIVFGDVGRSGLLEHLGIANARAIVLTMDDPVQLVATTRDVRAAYPNLCIIARAKDAEHAAQLYRAGATDAVPETLESSLQLAEAVLVDIGRPMGLVIASIHEMREIKRNKIKAMVPDLPREPLKAASRLRRSDEETTE
ncbi:cation:proton antiporter [Sphingosinicella sp.]|uniref:cation:proton antiporter domain-containing protein n=1 Tax=Sphingosinicella sp. TaxID=1917971 RepID=UPI001808FA8D|nr:cation:proton antiporter [Sphingosinicella sp.]MBA4757065.1 cation:proton antiporter [Sphingosinicella sp.]